MASVSARRAADARRRARQPYRKLFDHIRQGCRQRTPKFSKRMVALLGYDCAAFRERIEDTFTAGMSWDLFLKGDIHIDHEIPLASYDPLDVDQVRMAWSLSNVRAAWPEDNLAKLKDDKRVIAVRRWISQYPLVQEPYQRPSTFYGRDTPKSV